MTAVEPMMAALGGTWVACGGAADHEAVSGADAISVSTSGRPYRLRFVWLDDQARSGFYNGFSNEGLWALCHTCDVAPVFRTNDFRQYRAANEAFAAAVAAEAAGSSPLVFIHDYHCALAPKLVAERVPSATIVSFWHIPWPIPMVLDTCPWALQLLEGLLGSDVVGVQTRDDSDNFLECVRVLLGGRVDHLRRTVTYRGRQTTVLICPVGIDIHNEALRHTPSTAWCRHHVRAQFDLDDDVRLGVGVDRLDYTKGIHHKFLAIERMLERHPELQERFAFVQIAEPSRASLPAYRACRAQILETCLRINERFRSAPIRLVEAHRSQAQVYELLRAADVCYVGSLHDGMNLVAKEFVAARDDHRGVLLLSESAGAAAQLRAALRFDPRSVDQAAQALSDALAMSPAEQSLRLRTLRAAVTDGDVTWWSQRLLSAAGDRVAADRFGVPSVAGRRFVPAAEALRWPGSAVPAPPHGAGFADGWRGAKPRAVQAGTRPQ